MTGRKQQQAATAYAAALRLLARREHSRRELKSKLQLRAHEPQQIEEALDRLCEQNYLSDQRFAAAYVDERVAKGFGAARIEAELRERGIDGELIAAALTPFAESWDGLLAEAQQRKFGSEPPIDRREWLKRARFLQARGFRPDSIRRLLGDYE